MTSRTAHGPGLNPLVISWQNLKGFCGLLGNTIAVLIFWFWQLCCGYELWLYRRMFFFFLFLTIQGQEDIMFATYCQMVQNENKSNYIMPGSCLKSFRVFLFHWEQNACHQPWFTRPLWFAPASFLSPAFLPIAFLSKATESTRQRLLSPFPRLLLLTSLGRSLQFLD